MVVYFHSTMSKDKVTLYLDLDHVTMLRKIAEAKDTSPSRLIRLMIRQYIARNKSLLKKKEGK